jgi:ribonuclease Z
MLKTFALRGRQVPLVVYGPPGLAELFSALRRIFGKLTYDLKLVELRPGDELDRGDHRICAFEVEHGVNANGYALLEAERPGRFDVETARALGVPEGPLFGRLQAGEPVTGAGGTEVQPSQVLGPPRPGRKVVIAGDTRPARVVLEAAQGADLLVHEATFAAEEQERADETLHATAAEVAQLARAADVRMLALTHLSNRYFGPEIAREARAVFPETVVPRDFDIIDVRFPERGGPRLVKGGAAGRHEEGELHGSDGAGRGGEGSHGGGGDPDDLALGGDPVGAAARGRATPDRPR